jgi:hypothetical protein
MKLVKHYLLQPVVPQRAVKELRPFTTETPRLRELKGKWALSAPLAGNFFAAGEESKDIIPGIHGRKRLSVMTDTGAAG